VKNQLNIPARAFPRQQPRLLEQEACRLHSQASEFGTRRIVWVDETRAYPHERGLPATRWSKNCSDSAIVDFERNIIQDPPTVERFSHRFQPHEVIGSFILLSRGLAPVKTLRMR